MKSLAVTLRIEFQLFAVLQFLFFTNGTTAYRLFTFFEWDWHAFCLFLQWSQVYKLSWDRVTFLCLCKRVYAAVFIQTRYRSSYLFSFARSEDLAITVNAATKQSLIKWLHLRRQTGLLKLTVQLKIICHLTASQELKSGIWTVLTSTKAYFPTLLSNKVIGKLELTPQSLHRSVFCCCDFFSFYSRVESALSISMLQWRVMLSINQPINQSCLPEVVNRNRDRGGQQLLFTVTQITSTYQVWAGEKDRTFINFAWVTLKTAFEKVNMILSSRFYHKCCSRTAFWFSSRLHSPFFLWSWSCFACLEISS